MSGVDKPAEAEPVAAAPAEGDAREPSPATGETDGVKVVDDATADGEKAKPGKSSNACCQHPEARKKKKKNPYAEGFSDAIAGEDKGEVDKTSEDLEAEEEKKDEQEGEMIPEEKLIEELHIPVDDEDINLVQLRIFDISKVALSSLTKCKILQLRQNLIHDVHPFPENLHAGLEELDIYDNKVKAIPLHFNVFTKLRVLDLSYNNIRLIENLDIPTLEVLFLTENKITTIQNLDKLPNLKQLELGSNRIRKIENLEKLPLLEDLWLGKNKITSLQGLSNQTRLRRLSLQANRLTEIPAEALRNNTSLTDLHLSENGIKKMENVAHLKKIRLIDFCFNPITEIHEVDQLPAIEEFWCTDARIASWKEVEKLEKVKSLRTVYLERNPVEDARYRHKLALLMPGLTEIDSWPVARRDITGKQEDGDDPRGKWVDGEKAEITFKASRGDAPIMPSAEEVEAEKLAQGLPAAAPAIDVPAERAVADATAAPEAPQTATDSKPAHTDPEKAVDC